MTGARGRRQKKRTMTDQEGGILKEQGDGDRDKGTAAEEANHDRPGRRL